MPRKPVLETILPIALLMSACQEAGTDRIGMPGGEHDELPAGEASPLTWSCAGKFVSGYFDADSLTLQDGDQVMNLRQAVSASGARYVGSGDPPDREFWIKGNEASYRHGADSAEECFVVADPDRPDSSVLSGTWDVLMIGDEPVIDGSAVTLVFEGGQSLSGHNGCNRFGANYQLSLEGLVIGLIQSTLMACPEALMAQEQHFNSILSQVGSLRFDNRDSLALLTGEGQSIVAVRSR